MGVRHNQGVKYGELGGGPDLPKESLIPPDIKTRWGGVKWKLAYWHTWAVEEHATALIQKHAFIAWTEH